MPAQSRRAGLMNSWRGSPLPNGLADSHIALRGHEGGAAFGGLELEPALEHDDGSGLAVVAGPSAEAGADPCRIGERAPGMGVALSFGLAFEALAQGFDEGQVVRAEGVGDGPEAALTGAAVAGVDELLDGDGDEGRHGELAPGGVLADAHRLDVEALGLEGAEQLLDRPAAAVQVGDREGLGRIRDRERGEEPPVHALARRRVDLAHVDEVEDDALRQAGPHPVRWPRELDGHETDRHERLAGGAAGLCRQPQPRRPPSARASARPNSRPPSPRLRSWAARTKSSVVAGRSAKAAKMSLSRSAITVTRAALAPTSAARPAPSSQRRLSFSASGREPRADRRPASRARKQACISPRIAPSSSSTAKTACR